MHRPRGTKRPGQGTGNEDPAKRISNTDLDGTINPNNIVNQSNNATNNDEFKARADGNDGGESFVHTSHATINCRQADATVTQRNGAGTNAPVWSTTIRQFKVHGTASPAPTEDSSSISVSVEDNDNATEPSPSHKELQGTALSQGSQVNCSTVIDYPLKDLHVAKERVKGWDVAFERRLRGIMTFRDKGLGGTSKPLTLWVVGEVTTQFWFDDRGVPAKRVAISIQPLSSEIHLLGKRLLHGTAMPRNSSLVADSFGPDQIRATRWMTRRGQRGQESTIAEFEHFYNGTIASERQVLDGEVKCGANHRARHCSLGNTNCTIQCGICF
ncbi:hypothetical protein R3P38DRAFT_2775082 [Favolaschia claudopus]|uniref:Uncharacterized protein n=1 Tax=Favolaschia claudopus TaxID=2862362 RepID=A0AAW0C002_9AGAR